MIRVQYHKYLWIVIAVGVNDERNTEIGIGLTKAAARRHLFKRIGI